MQQQKKKETCAVRESSHRNTFVVHRFVRSLVGCFSVFVFVKASADWAGPGIPRQYSPLACFDIIYPFSPLIMYIQKMSHHRTVFLRRVTMILFGIDGKVFENENKAHSE